MEMNMKTFTAHIHKSRQFQTMAVQDHLPEMVISIREILALLSAVTVAAAAIMLAIWVAGMDISSFIGAGTWGIAMIFFAMAMDNRKAKALLQLSTGGVLMVLAWLQYAVSPDYTVVVGVLVAGWIAVAVLKRLK
jgi:hypothetical protein